MLRIDLAWRILSIEMRKHLSYRVDFLVNFFGTMLVEIGMAYFLWRAIFDYLQVIEVGGYTYLGMITYYCFAHAIGSIIKGQEMHFISSDIYDGGLSQYLVYPIVFVYYKLLGHFAFGLIATVKLLIAVFVFWGLLGVAPDVALTPLNVLLGTLTAWMAAVLYFFLAASVELTAFWTDGVWSLSVMLKNMSRLFGGAVVPLSLFPVWSSDILQGLPFYYITAFPVKTTLGRVSWEEWLLGMLILSLWTIVMAAVYRIVWQRGTRTYSGIGM